MEDVSPRYLSGILLEWPGGRIEVSHILQCKEMKADAMIPKSRWETYVFRSTVPLRPEDEGKPPPFDNFVVARRSGPRMLVLAEGRGVVSHLAFEVLNNTVLSGLRPVSIAVDDLVKSIVSRPTDFVLSFVHAKVPAFGASLRAASFYGDDLGEATLFRDNIKLLTAFTCGLRRAVGGTELVRLSGDGAVSFYLAAPTRVLEVEEVLSFLRQHGYLSSDIWRD